MRGVNERTKQFFKELVKILQPPENLDIQEWADLYRILPKEGAAESGKWVTARTPYMIEIFKCMTDIDTESITMMTGAQIGKTELLLNILGRYMHIDPCPILMVQPTVDDARAFSQERVAPMIRDTKVLRKIVINDTVQQKSFYGGYVRFVGSNSPSGLASRPIRITLLDEVDRFPVSSGAEGSPVELAEKRTTTFINKKKIRTSTPTIANKSAIERLMNESTYEEWSLPCPHCEEYTPLEFENLKWENNDPKTAKFMCPACGTLSTESRWKSKKQLNGKWIARFPERIKNRGFHMNSLASPWRTWESIVEEFLKVKDNPQEKKVFWNTVLGKPWVLHLSGAIEYRRLFERKKSYEHDNLSKDIKIITAGVDVQDDRLEVEVVGWCNKYKSYGLIYKKFFGNPGDEKVWNELDQFLLQKFKIEDGREEVIRTTCIDSGGHHTSAVYKFCMARQWRNVYAIKGVGGEGKKPIIGISHLEKEGSENVDLLLIGVNSIKDMVCSALKAETDEENGYCEFPLRLEYGYDITYFKGITSEVKTVDETVRGDKIIWKVIKGRRNEPFDLRVYALAAVLLTPINLNSGLEETPEQLAICEIPNIEITQNMGG